MPTIKFLDLNRFIKNLTPITTNQLLTRTNEFHPQGLFSELIFGPLGSLERRKTFSYIPLNAYVIHPAALKILMQLDRRIDKFISTQNAYSLDKEGLLKEDENGVTGMNEFVKLFSKINFRGGSETRDKYIKLVKDAHSKNILFIRTVPVIPPDHRPASQNEETKEWTIDPLNDYYTTILNRSFQVASAGKSGPLFDLLNYGLQLAVNEHHEFIQTKVGKKYGIIRSQLLGKRVEYSGRAVITAGPSLKVDEIGLPMKLAVGLFEPFLIHVLLNARSIDRDKLNQDMKSFTGAELSVESIRRVIKSIKYGDDVPEEVYDVFYQCTDIAMTGRVVLAKRDPVLHPESVRAFKPVLIKGNTIQICTLQTGGFNADFDGDQMAVFHPLSNESQEEARTRMMRSATGNTPTITFELSKEMNAGLYMITKDIPLKKSPISITKEDLENATDPYIAVVYKGKNMTMGKAIFNNSLPEGYPFYNGQVTKKVANTILRKINDTMGEEIAKETATKFKNIGFKFATILAPSITLDNVKIPAEIYRLKAKLDKATTEEQIDIISKMREIMINHLKNTGLYDLVESGSTKGWDQPIQILVAKGIIADPEGNILPAIKGSFSDGLTPKEYFTATSGARKGIIDRVLNTAYTGYTSRQLAFLLNSVEVDLFLKDCKTTRTLDLKLDSDLMSRLTGRYIVKGDRIVEFNKDDFKVGDTIHLRTPVYCKSLKMCHTCYGRLLERHKTPYVGILAAQIIGERGTQLIMRTFHSGGAIKISVRDILKDIIENDPLVEMSTISKCLEQETNTLIAKKPFTLTINMDDYDMDGSISINEEDNVIWVRSLLSRVEFGDVMFNIILDYPVDLHIKDMTQVGKEKIILKYEEGESILDVPLEKQELKEQVLYVGRLLGGREVFKDTHHLIMKLYKVYGPIAGDMDFVHLEVLISQCLRDKNNPSLPARVGKNPDDPEMANIKKNIFNTGFIQGLAFENVGQAIKTGLTTDSDLPPSIIERIMTGDLVKKKSDED